MAPAQHVVSALLSLVQRHTTSAIEATRLFTTAARRSGGRRGERLDPGVWDLIVVKVCVPDPKCSEPSREGRALVCNRAVERRFRARYLRIGR